MYCSIVADGISMSHRKTDRCSPVILLTRQLAFTTPPAERARRVEEAKRLYRKALGRIGLMEGGDV